MKIIVIRQRVGTCQREPLGTQHVEKILGLGNACDRMQEEQLTVLQRSQGHCLPGGVDGRGRQRPLGQKTRQGVRPGVERQCPALGLTCRGYQRAWPGLA